jgi:hypothetical protein
MPAEQRLLRAQRSTATAFNALQCAPESEHAQLAHQTVYRTCPVHHRTAQRPHQSELQRSEPNGRLTWLAHRTVSGGAPDCPVRHATTVFQRPHFGGWGYKYPNHPTFNCIQVFHLSVFWVRPHTRGCPSRCFRSRTVSPTIAKWFVPDARGTMDDVYRFGPL